MSSKDGLRRHDRALLEARLSVSTQARRSGRDEFEEELLPLQARIANLSAALSPVADPPRDDLPADALLKQMRAGLVVIDPSGRHVWVNPAFCRMVERDPEEVVGATSPAPYWDLERKAELSAAFDALVADRLRAPIQLRFRKKSGASFPVDLHASAIRASEDGVARYFVLIVLDASTRRDPEHADPEAKGWADLTLTLEQAEARYVRAVLDQVGFKIEGPSGAATRLGVPPSTLRSRMRKLGISRP